MQIPKNVDMARDFIGIFKRNQKCPKVCMCGCTSVYREKINKNGNLMLMERWGYPALTPFAQDSIIQSLKSSFFACAGDLLKSFVGDL